MFWIDIKPDNRFDRLGKFFNGTSSEIKITYENLSILGIEFK